jgi:hypothetical protein
MIKTKQNIFMEIAFGPYGGEHVSWAICGHLCSKNSAMMGFINANCRKLPVNYQK